jgi:hypothetical protein
LHPQQPHQQQLPQQLPQQQQIIFSYPKPPINSIPLADPQQQQQQHPLAPIPKTPLLTETLNIIPNFYQS